MRNFSLSAICLVVVALVSWFLVGNLWGDRLLNLPQDVTIEVTHDTLSFSDVKPLTVDSLDCDTLRSRYIFADTMDVPRWRAEVVGRDVELKSLMMLERTERHTATSVVGRRPSWEVSLIGDVSNRDAWVGVGVQRNFGAFSFGVTAGANPINGAPSVGARGSILLWQR